MNDLVNSASPDSIEDAVQPSSSWHQFWFASASSDLATAVRATFCLLAAFYFVSSLSDASAWLAIDSPLASSRIANFLKLAGLESEGNLIVSPLFLIDAGWLYQAWLLIGIVVSVLALVGKGGRVTVAVLWLMVVMWANRIMFLSGLSETLLSLGLFASMFAVPRSVVSLMKQGDAPDFASSSWADAFASRLWGIQVSAVLIATVMAMLASPVWFNGLGAYALAAPAMDRVFDLTGIDSPLVITPVHELLTHAIIFLPVVGLVMGWFVGSGKIGRALLWIWCIVVAVLGSHFLYAGCLAAMIAAIGRPMRVVPGSQMQSVG